MNQRDKERFAALVINCERVLAEPTQQSELIWRSDMRAVVAAWRELNKTIRFEPVFVTDAKPAEPRKRCNAEGPGEFVRCGRYLGHAGDHREMGGDEKWASSHS